MASSHTARFVGVLVAAGCCMLVATAASSDPVGNDSPGPVYAVTYSIADLPVYLLSQEFDPSVLIAHMKKSIDPKSWNSGGEVGVFPNNLSIVVTQTEANHPQVAELLDSFRRGPVR